MSKGKVGYLNLEERGTPQCKWKDCHLEFENNRILLNHVRQVHTSKSTFNDKCKWGQCYFTTRGNTLRNHVKKHIPIVEAICNICSGGRSFKWRFDLSKHLQKFHSGSSTRITNIQVDGFDIYIAIVETDTNARKTSSDMPCSLARILD